MTSSVQPPVLNPPLGTPSNEWAKKTASSFDPSSQETPQNTTSEQPTRQSPSVTPGNELPGAFPNSGQGETSTSTTNITDTIVDTAKQYIPASVMSTVGNFLGNNSSGTTGTDKQVRASEHDIYHKASLPSQELRGALPHEHVGGVGSLPGASIEKSVAVLPDEQADWSEWSTFAGRNTPGYQTPSNLKANAPSLAKSITQKATGLGVAAGIIKADVPPKPESENVSKTDDSPKPKSEDVGKADAPAKPESEDVGKGYPETITSHEIADAQQAVGNIKPVAFDIKPAQDVSLPSTETQGQQPGEHTGGIGTLPGSKEEQGVAVLPEERTTKTETERSERSEEQSEPSGKPKGVGVSGATDLLKKETRSREPPTEPETVPSGQKTASPEPVQTGRASHESNDLGGTQRSAGSEGESEGQHKATLRERISGGIKVVSGKLGHDKSKVEEGKKLMHGQSA